MDVLRTLGLRRTPQSERADPRQVPNAPAATPSRSTTPPACAAS